jgi:hypothetical protein
MKIRTKEHIPLEYPCLHLRLGTAYELVDGFVAFAKAKRLWLDSYARLSRPPPASQTLHAAFILFHFLLVPN